MVALDTIPVLGYEVQTFQEVYSLEINFDLPFMIIIIGNIGGGGQ